MFGISIRKLSNTTKHGFFVTRTVEVDTLPEAERLATLLASDKFPDTPIVLVHKGDLEYEIFEVSEPVGIVKIKTK